MVVKLRRERGNGDGKKTSDSRGDGAHTVAHKDQGNLDPGHVRTFGPAFSCHDTRATSIGLGSLYLYGTLVE